MTLDMDHLRQWIGRTEDVATAATLDRDDPEPGTGDG
jgi:hypothetical protein